MPDSKGNQASKVNSSCPWSYELQDRFWKLTTFVIDSSAPLTFRIEQNKMVAPEGLPAAIAQVVTAYDAVHHMRSAMKRPKSIHGVSLL